MANGSQCCRRLIQRNGEVVQKFKFDKKNTIKMLYVFHNYDVSDCFRSLEEVIQNFEMIALFQNLTFSSLIFNNLLENHRCFNS